MPELPEVEVVRRGLEPHMLGSTITGAKVLEPRSLRRHGGGAAHFQDVIAGRRVRSIERRGKFLWLVLDGDEALMVHLGMSGQMLVRTPGGPAPIRHRRATLELDGGTAIDFVDQRIFGGLWVSPLVQSEHGPVPEAAAHIALDPLDPAFDLDVAARAMKRRSSAVKAVLLNQEVVSGIGNIYADEALWASRVHYLKPASAIGLPKLRQLLSESRSVMERALAEGGTSFDALYVDVDGNSGYFGRSLQAYGREGASCPRCARPIARRVWTNRSSFLCPTCQRR